MNKALGGDDGFEDEGQVLLSSLLSRRVKNLFFTLLADRGRGHLQPIVE